MTTIEIELPPKLIDVFTDGPDEQIDYRGAYGGRGSGKTYNFAKMSAVRGAALAQAGRSGQILCAREFMSSLADSSMSEVKAAIASEPWLSSLWTVGESFIRTKGFLPGRVDYSFTGLGHNLGNLKSKARILLCWVDEAERVSEEAWSVLLPTVRDAASEIWVTWNPEHEGSATDLRWRQNPPDNAKIACLNWQDNPWFDATRLGRQRLDDLRNRPSQYGWIWDGDYAAPREGGLFDISWLRYADDFPRGAKRVRYWDLAGSEVSAKNADPDYSAGALLAEKDGIYYLAHMVRGRWSPLGTQHAVQNTAQWDGKDVRVFIQQDPGQAGKMQIDHYARHVLLGFAFRGHHKGAESKASMADPLAAAMEAGNFRIVRKTADGFGLSEAEIRALCNEFDMFGRDRAGVHDDMIDAITGAFDRLSASPRLQPIRARVI